MKTWDELKADLLAIEDAIAELLRESIDEPNGGIDSRRYKALNRQADIIGHKMDAMNKK